MRYNCSMDNTDQYDVAIAGGGLAGMTLACLLGKAGIKTACIDQAPVAASPSADLRTTAVSFGSRKILIEAGIWDSLVDRACPIDDIRILDGASSVLLNFLKSEVEEKSFGWIVLNSDLRASMLNVMKSLPSVTHIAPEKIKDYAVDSESAQVILEDGRSINARLIVGADGRNSFTRAWMNVHVREWSYNQRAIVCTASHEHPHNNVAVEHFWPEGPFAILPMMDAADGAHRSAVVFTEHGPDSRSFMKLDDAAFAVELAARFPPDYGTVKLLGSRAAYPLGLAHASEYIAPRMALVADAAHGIHPIAGQGLNLGFRDVKELAGLLAVSHAQSGDPGASELLTTYQRRRRPDNMAMAAVTDGLNRLFSNNIMPVRLLRRAGLRMVSRLAPAKGFFMRQAMGDRDR